jgi:thioester reductase-like protein
MKVFVTGATGFIGSIPLLPARKPSNNTAGAQLRSA